MMSLLSKKNTLPDHNDPCPPYFLKADNLFARNRGKELFIKKIYSVSPDIPKRGSVIMAPGIATNANIFRIDDRGEFLSLNHNRSFANLLASEGFTVYLYHPSYTERTHNRYVCKHCKDSIYYLKKYEAPSKLTFAELVKEEVPLVIDFVCDDSGEKSVSWIGYSLGGMLIYSYLSKNQDISLIKNVVAIGSPISLSQIFIRIIPYTNIASKWLGFEERSFVGAVSENFVPLTRLIRILPGYLLRYNLLSMLLFNPMNIYTNTIKTLLGKVVEPIPAMLEKSFANIIAYGPYSRRTFTNYLVNLRQLRQTKKNFLFFFGPNDVVAPPDSIYLAHEIIGPHTTNNLVEVPSAGHVDLIVGKKSMEYVWVPTMEWLKGMYDAEKNGGVPKCQFL